jgi:two-component system CheB/CheR fusion protein
LFAALAKRVFPHIVGEGDGPIRIWVPGCETGEDVYALAIALVEYLGERSSNVPVQAFGTDVESDAIERARRGLYPAAAVDGVGRSRRGRFFRRSGPGYEVSKEVRGLCVFGRHDLVRDPPFANLDLLLCQGVLSRLEASSRQTAVSLLRYALKPSGLLLTRRGEAVDGFDGAFTRLGGPGSVGVWRPAGLRSLFALRLPGPGGGTGASLSSPPGPSRRGEDTGATDEVPIAGNEELDALNDDLLRRNAELDETRSDLQNLLGSLDLRVVLLGRDLRIRRFTPLAQREWRLQPSDVGRPLSDTRLGVQLPVAQRLAAEVLAGAQAQSRDVRDPAGRWQSLRVLPYLSAEGAVEGAVVTLADIHALKEAQHRFQAIVELAPDAMVIVDPGGRIALANARVEGLFGYRRAEILGRPLEALLPEGPNARQGLLRLLGDRDRHPGGAQWEIVARRKDGDLVPVEVSLSRIDMDEGTFVSTSFRDAGERRRLEERARRAAVLDERNRLAREVHDNLAQGLSAIVVLLEGAEEVLTSDVEEARRRVVKAREQARDDLVEARRALLALRPGPLDAVDLPEAIRGMAAPLAAGVEVEVSVRGRRGRLLPLFEDNLLRIAQEAVGNALKHAGARRVRAHLTYAPDAFRMRIDDDGCGFDPGGARSGFGLAIMKERAERMGADLRIRSNASRGTRVEVRVPLGASASEG